VRCLAFSGQLDHPYLTLGGVVVERDPVVGDEPEVVALTVA
jgi:hypothetical protein